MKKFAKIMTPVLSGVLAVGVLAACNIGTAAPNAPGKQSVGENKGNPAKGESKYETADGRLEPGDRGGVDDTDKPGNGPKSKGDDINGNGKGQYDHKPGRDRDDNRDKNSGGSENTGVKPDRNSDNKPNLNNKPDRNRDRDESGSKPGGCAGTNRNNNNCKPQRTPQNSGCSQQPREPRPATGGCGGAPTCCSSCGDNQQGRPNMGGPDRPNKADNPPGMDRGNAPFDKAEHRERGGKPDFNNPGNNSSNGKGKGKGK